jgi:hypothetical protein
MGGDAERLRELHDSYVWEVNAAVGEGRMDVVWRLVDDYMDTALRVLTSTDDGLCGDDCPVCAATRAQVARRARRRRIRPASWRRRRAS